MFEAIIDLALPGFAAALGFTTLIWLGSLVKRDASIVDIFWSPGFCRPVAPETDGSE